MFLEFSCRRAAVKASDQNRSGAPLAPQIKVLWSNCSLVSAWKIECVIQTAVRIYIFQHVQNAVTLRVTRSDDSVATDLIPPFPPRTVCGS